MELKLIRYSGNPILKPTSLPWENKWVYNCGVTEYEGKVLLLYRAQGDDNISRFGVALSEDGYTISERWKEPVFEPDTDSEYETLGVEDPRISRIGETYYIVYTAASKYPALKKDDVFPDDALGSVPWRVRACIAHTKNFRCFTRHGVVISHIDSKDAALFPEKIDNKYVLIHRVMPDIRLAVGDDFHSFKERGPVLRPRDDGWDGERIGVGSPPIKTPYGWLAIYHGTSKAKKVYSLGFILFDINNPLLVIGRSSSSILEPEKDYELDGQVDNVVFSCGMIVWKDELLVYYGAADNVIGVASIKWKKVLDWAKSEHSKFY